MSRGEFAPLRLALAWMLGTYVVFLLLGQVSMIDNVGTLTIWVVVYAGALAAGYWWRMIRYRSVPPPTPRPITDHHVQQIRLIVAASAIYYFAYGFVYMGEYGVRSLSAVVAALTDPGNAYKAKFAVLADQIATGANNSGAQLLTLSAVLSAPLVPFLIVYWHRISVEIRILAAIGIASYVALFVAIGTLFGLGNIVIFAVSGFIVASPDRSRRRGVIGV